MNRGAPDVLKLLHFTPTFMNLIRFENHGPFKPKFTYGEIYTKVRNSKVAGSLYFHLRLPEKVELVMHKFS